MKKLFFVPFLFWIVMASAQTNVVIVPQPVSMEMHSGTFPFITTTNIIAEKGTQHEADMLNMYLKKLYGIQLPVKNQMGNGNFITFKLLPGNDRKDAYNLNVGANNIIISSTGNEGLFYGLQTLLQLLGTEKQSLSQVVSIPQLAIKDYPRFQYRGMHLDVGRHFFDVDFVKKYIDYLAYLKYNTFHWHLTEDRAGESKSKNIRDLLQ